MIGLERLTSFLNGCEPAELKEVVDELERRTEEILDNKGAEIHQLIVSAIKNRDVLFHVWFCFLRGNFLRGKDVLSNRAFARLCNEIGTGDCYYDALPEGDILPTLRWQYARHVETVLQMVRDRYGSGKKLAEKIREIAQHYSDPLLLYLELVRFLKEFKGIGNKIANGIVGEMSWAMYLLNRFGEHARANALLEQEWYQNLLLSSFFNVMIDTHVRNFFKYQLKLKDVDQLTLVLLGKQTNRETIETLFEQHFHWVKNKDKKMILGNYAEFVGANLIEKLIWRACFVKKNSEDADVKELKIFQMSNLF